MKTNLFLVALAGAFLLVPSAFCQQEKGQVEQTAPEAAPEAENVSWVWGEIKSLDAAAASLNVIYMDYQTDEEKELLLNTDAQTQYEGVSGFGGIKAGDTASIDYIIKDGKNIARNISIEKIEAMPEAPVNSEEMPQEPAPEQKAQ